MPSVDPAHGGASFTSFTQYWRPKRLRGSARSLPGVQHTRNSHLAGSFAQSVRGAGLRIALLLDYPPSTHQTFLCSLEEKGVLALAATIKSLPQVGVCIPRLIIVLVLSRLSQRPHYRKLIGETKQNAGSRIAEAVQLQY